MKEEIKNIIIKLTNGVIDNEKANSITEEIINLFHSKLENIPKYDVEVFDGETETVEYKHGKFFHVHQLEGLIDKAIK